MISSTVILLQKSTKKFNQDKKHYFEISSADKVLLQFDKQIWHFSSIYFDSGPGKRVSTLVIGQF